MNVYNIYYSAIYYLSWILNLTVKQRRKKKRKMIAKCYLKRFIYIYIYITACSKLFEFQNLRSHINIINIIWYSTFTLYMW